MISTFWTNTIWYVLLGVASIIVLIFSMVKADRRKPAFAFFLTVFGITLNFELAILILFKSYEYYPMVFMTAPFKYNDILLGNVFSQLAVSSTIFFAAVYKLKFKWYLIFAAIFGGVEELFIALGIYSHNWYRTWMTIVILPFSYWIGHIMYIWIMRVMKPIFYYFYIAMGLFPLYVLTLLFGIELTGHMYFKTNIVPDSVQSHYLPALTIFFIFPSFTIMLVYFLKLKWYWKVLSAALLYLIHYLCHMYNLFWIKEGWLLPFSIISIIWIYLSVLLLDKLYGRNKKTVEKRL